MKSFGRKKKGKTRNKQEKKNKIKYGDGHPDKKLYHKGAQKRVFFVLFFITVSLRVVFRTRLFLFTAGGRRKKNVTIAALILFDWEGHLYKHVWIFIVASKVESFLIGKMCQDFFFNILSKTVSLSRLVIKYSIKHNSRLTKYIDI